jgi:hypothetical protein
LSAADAIAMHNDQAASEDGNIVSPRQEASTDDDQPLE